MIGHSSIWAFFVLFIVECLLVGWADSWFVGRGLDTSYSTIISGLADHNAMTCLCDGYNSGQVCTCSLDNKRGICTAIYVAKRLYFKKIVFYLRI